MADDTNYKMFMGEAQDVKDHKAYNKPDATEHYQADSPGPVPMPQSDPRTFANIDKRNQTRWKDQTGTNMPKSFYQTNMGLKSDNM